MEKIATEVTYEGRLLRQIERTETAAIYETYGLHGQVIGYELIVIKHLPAKRIFDKEYPEREGYPNSEEWGKLGWSYPIKEKETMHNRLVKLTERLTGN